EDFLVPTIVTLSPGGGVTPGKPIYPKPVDAKLAFSETPLAVYEHEFTIEVPLKAAVNAAKGEQELAGLLKFQSCNDQGCLPAAATPVHGDVKVEGEAAAISATATTPEKVTAPDLSEKTTPAMPPAAGPSQKLSEAPPSGTHAGSSDLVGNWFDQR